MTDLSIVGGTRADHSGLGLDPVQLIIARKRNGVFQWWNGAGWVGARSGSEPATLLGTSPEGANGWSRNNTRSGQAMPPISDFYDASDPTGADNNLFFLEARVRVSDADVERRVYKQCRVDKTTPTIAITAPAPNSVIPRLTTLSGTLQAATRPARVTLNFYRRVGGVDQVWSPTAGVGWQAKTEAREIEARRDVTLAVANGAAWPSNGTTTWTYTGQVPPVESLVAPQADLSRVTVYARAESSVGLLGHDLETYTIDRKPPAVFIDVPGSGAVLNALPSVQGRATDDKGVTSLWFTLQRDADNAWWDSGRRSGTPRGWKPFRSPPVWGTATDGANLFVTGFTAGQTSASWQHRSGELPNAAELSDGGYTLVAYAEDADGNQSTVTRPFTINKAAQNIARLQYSLDEGATWVDVPQPGQAGFPLTVDQGTYVDFRAVKTQTGAAWPAGKPVWSGDGGVEGESGETTWGFFDDYSRDNSDLFTVSAECGNTLSAKLRVRPRSAVYVWSDYDSVLAGGAPSGLASTTVYAEVVDKDGNPVPNARVNFAAKHADNSNAGQINAAGTADDVATTGADGIAQVTLTSGSKLGEVTLSATSSDSVGPIASGVDGDWLVFFSPPIATVDFGAWQTGTNGQQNRSCTVNVFYEGSVVANRAIKLRVKVTDTAGNPVSAEYQNAAQLASLSGFTNSTGQFGTTLRWVPPNSNPIATPTNFLIVIYVDDATITQ